MPLIRKIIPCGKTSKGIILPKSWLEYAEYKEGKPVIRVSMEEVHGALIIKPFYGAPEN